MVFDSRTENTLVIVDVHLFPAIISDPLPKESSYIIWFHSKDSGLDNLTINRSRIFLLFEHDICCAFNLLDHSCITKAKAFRNRTVAFCKNIANFMKSFGIDPVGKLLDNFRIGDFEKRIIKHTIGNVFLLRLVCEKVVVTHIKLQAKRSPCRHTQIT